MQKNWHPPEFVLGTSQPVRSRYATYETRPRTIEYKIRIFRLCYFWKNSNIYETKEWACALSNTADNRMVLFAAFVSITCRDRLRGLEVIPVVLLGCDAVSLGEGSPTDRTASYSGWNLKMKALRSFETSEITQRHSVTSRKTWILTASVIFQLMFSVLSNDVISLHSMTFHCAQSNITPWRHVTVWKYGVKLFQPRHYMKEIFSFMLQPL